MAFLKIVDALGLRSSTKPPAVAEGIPQVFDMYCSRDNDKFLAKRNRSRTLKLPETLPITSANILTFPHSWMCIDQPLSSITMRLSATVYMSFYKYRPWHGDNLQFFTSFTIMCMAG